MLINRCKVSFCFICEWRIGQPGIAKIKHGSRLHIGLFYKGSPGSQPSAKRIPTYISVSNGDYFCLLKVITINIHCYILYYINISYYRKIEKCYMPKSFFNTR